MWEDIKDSYIIPQLYSINSITPPKDPYSYELCLEELQNTEDLENEILMQAIEVLRDRQYAIAFMNLKEPMQLHYNTYEFSTWEFLIKWSLPKDN